MSGPWAYSALPDRPRSRWPGGARVALWVAVGVEAYRPDGGRTEDILPPTAGTDLINTAWRDYGNRAGAFRLIDRLSALGIRPTVLLNTDVYDEAPQVLAAARRAEAEIVAHGLSNSDSLASMTAQDERAYLQTCRSRIADTEGQSPGGWSSPWLEHRETTLQHLSQTGFDYVLDFRLDDQPVWLDTACGPILSIPYAAELNDSTTMIGRGASAETFAHMIREEFAELASAPGDQAVVMSVVLHSFISGQPFRLGPVMRALAKIAEQSETVWLATPRDIHAAVLADPKLAVAPS